MAFSYVGPAALRFAGADAIERAASVNVTLGETMPGLFELSFPHDLAESKGALSVRVTLPDGQVMAGEVRFLAASSLTFRVDRSGPV